MRKFRVLLWVGILALAPLLLADTAGTIGKYPLDSESMMQWRLPDRLKEISGLALTDDGRLFAMDDEIAVIYELDYDSGRLIKAFALGEKIVKGDFEGIAVVDGLVYLTTSAGRVFFSGEGADGQRVSFDTYQTGLGDYCEIEGLVQSSDNTRLYFLCKNVRDRKEIEGLMVFAWSVEERELIEEESVLLPEREILAMLRMDRFNPSGLTLDRRTGNFIILSARQRALVEVTGRGELVDARLLTLTARHRQAEGIELTNDERLVIADEGGSHRARLAVYHSHAIDK